MSDPGMPASLSRCRALARQLLRQFRADDSEVARRAAIRLGALRSFADVDVDQLLAARDRVRLKHALVVVAQDAGFASWLDLKRGLERAEAAPEQVAMYVPRLSTFLNRWFADYAEARASLEAEGGYLLPYRNQFFVTEGEAIRELGLDPDDPDWQRIGRDWVRPADAAAHERLVVLRRAAMIG